MKGQAAIEFLAVFCATLALVSMLAAAVIAQKDAAGERRAELEGIMKAEAAARAVETMLNSGCSISFDFRDENVFYRLESGLFRVSFRSRIIEVGGAFADDDSEAI